MSYGTLSLEQQEALAPFLRGKEVHDLGAGDLRLSQTLLRLGAKHVFAVEKEARLEKVPENVTYLRKTFSDFRGDTPLVFVSWPVNWNTGLRRILENAEIVLYLGKNTDGTSCGDATVWGHLATREILLHLPEDPNTLVVYGPRRVTREKILEEQAALDTSRIYYLRRRGSEF